MTRFRADLYRLLHRGCPGDVDFYVDRCRGAESGLELGCGDGRVSQAVASVCTRVVGIDNHPEMLAMAKQSAAKLEWPDSHSLGYVLSDICDIEFCDEFDVVIMPFTTFFCLPPTTKKSVLKLVLKAMKPGGRFVFDTYPADLNEMVDDSDFEPLTTLHDKDQIIHVFERCQVDHKHEIIDVTYGHDIFDGRTNEWYSYTIRHHYLSPLRISEVLAEAGFQEIDIIGDFIGHSWPESQERAIFEARKP